MSTVPLAPTPTKPRLAEPKRMNVFERYLTGWVTLCMVAGMVLGRSLPDLVEALRGLEFRASSQINAPIAVLIWLMPFVVPPS